MKNLLVYILIRESTFLWISLALFGVFGLPLLNMLRKTKEVWRKFDTSKETIQRWKKQRRIFYSIAFGLPALSLVVGLATAAVDYETLKREWQYEVDLPKMVETCQDTPATGGQEYSKDVQQVIAIIRGERFDYNQVGARWGEFFSFQDNSPYPVTYALDSADAIYCIEITYPSSHSCTLFSPQGIARYVVVGVPVATIKMVAWPEKKLMRAWEPAYVRSSDECSNAIQKDKILDIISQK